MPQVEKPSSTGPDLRAFYDGKAEIYRRHDLSLCTRDERVLETMPAGTGLRVLDVGCASGAFMQILSGHGHNAEGIDISPRAVALAREAGCVAVVANPETGEGLDELAGPYDVITLLDVLEHTFGPGLVVTRLQPLLAPGGCFVISVPNLGCVAGRLTLLRGRFPSEPQGLFDGGHIRWFTRREMGSWWPGFAVARCTGTPIPVSAAARRILGRPVAWRLLRLLEWGLAALGRRFPGLWGYQLVFRLVPVCDHEGDQNAATSICGDSDLRR